MQALSRYVPWFAIALILASFTYLSCYYFYGAGIDDDFITLWSGETLGADWWFINYNGDRSEMTSSILAAFVAKIAFWIAPSASYVINKLLLFACAPAALMLPWIYRRELFSENASALALAAMAAAAGNVFLQCWSQSSLEAPLHVLVLTWYALELIAYLRNPERKMWPVILLQIAVILVRVEGFWVIVSTVSALLFTHPRHFLSLSRSKLWLVPLLFLLALLSARWAATGLPLPNPAYAKVSGVFDKLNMGVSQLHGFYSYNPTQLFLLVGLIAGAAITAIQLLTSRGRVQGEGIPFLVLSLVIAAQETFFVLIGGGFGQLYRMLVPTVLLKWILCAAAAGEIWKQCNTLNRTVLASMLAVYMAVGIVNEDAIVAPQPKPHHRAWKYGMPQSLEEFNWMSLRYQIAHGRDVAMIYPFISHQIPRHIQSMGELRILTTQAGFFPYYIKKLYPDARIRFFDVKGLVNPEVGFASIAKSVTGVRGAGAYHIVLGGEHGISPLVKAFDPNILYATRTSPEAKSQLAQMGWKLVVDKAVAVVWIKAKSD